MNVFVPAGASMRNMQGSIHECIQATGVQMPAWLHAVGGFVDVCGGDQGVELCRNLIIGAAGLRWHFTKASHASLQVESWRQQVFKNFLVMVFALLARMLLAPPGSYMWTLGIESLQEGRGNRSSQSLWLNRRFFAVRHGEGCRTSGGAELRDGMLQSCAVYDAQDAVASLPVVSADSRRDRTYPSRLAFTRALCGPLRKARTC